MNNSEILFIYDAKLCNPNGDPDDENRPRMDYERERNLVSDLRLKRYIRDYLEENGYEIFVTKPDGKTVNATDRLKLLIEKSNKKIDLNKFKEDDVSWLLSQLIDVRLFGATMPIKSDTAKGSSLVFTGPVQFNWGYSLNKVRLVDSNGITSHFSSERENSQGAMGKDYRVYYSLIAFHGIISASRAKHTMMSDGDIKLLEEAIIKAIPLQATRSKIGQYPRLFVRVEYKDNGFMIGDLRDCVEPDKVDELREIDDFKLDITRLSTVLRENANRINKVYFWQDEKLVTKSNGNEGRFDKLINLSDDMIQEIKY
ncbi:type I-B CRISPR-associated protein Cas7/Csh2 [Thermoanaerobacterium thermosaccharolyticum]|uniref:CRISPR-associated protein Csh2 n=1 Tax=Thermoanaerobacterium butyriciformans TaxID=1702242 RepID=A0ABS4NHW8_9THEO|nr:MULTISPECIES: type I-B CRISPR-associated protein Cas7/Csh2 [Thermoanaerobacterium]MBP2073269.1 CRISPR-associated protein Csh2 [Thermoanaerobacterium butyriciformans]PHO07265.1 type I-B CRISPR-associated protein Cas7/Csh2 [Thermoanaerobacterium thermosaccharolyticum]